MNGRSAVFWALAALLACGDDGAGAQTEDGTTPTMTTTGGATEAPTTDGPTGSTATEPLPTTGPPPTTEPLPTTGGETDTGEPPPAGFRCLAPPADAVAELPQVQVDTAYPPLTGQSIAVAEGEDLQAAIDAAQLGDELVLAAGATFTGNFVVPEKAGDGWLVIRGADAGDLPEHVRVTADDAAGMPTLMTTNGLAVVSTQGAAHHVRFVGVQFRPADGVDVNDLLVLGDAGATSADLLAHDLVFDRCVVRGDPAVGGKRGIQLNARAVGVVDSYFTDWKRVGQDTQALLGWNTPGPFRIVNNHIEGAAENVMFGGADAKIADVIPSDIEICGNTFVKPLRWKEGDPGYEGTHWSIKNLFELKVGRRVLISGNVFEQAWTDAQTGFAIVIKSANQDGGQPWAVTEHVSFVYNHIRLANGGVAVSRSDGGSLGTNHVRIEGNLVERIGGDEWGGDGRAFQLLDGIADVRLAHNTGLGRNQAIVFDGMPCPGLAIVDNLFGPTTYGVFGSGKGEGQAALDAYAPGAPFAGNVVVGAPAGSYPPGNFFPASVDEVGFVDAAGGDYALQPGSMFAGVASDGADPGYDAELLARALAGDG
ncbi:MAG: hypothetical protein JNL82_20345 [Myxococcales bacterium]|nr:hypothetical protein [Myxococcales bacterium]